MKESNYIGTKKLFWRIIILLIITIIVYIILSQLTSSTLKSQQPSQTIYASVRFAAKENNRPTSIPLILHQTWKNEKLSFLLKPWVKSCIAKNDDFEYWFWNDHDIRKFILEQYPNFIKLFDSYPTDGYRADVFRYFALHHYGGIYLDVDVECLQSFRNMTLNHDCFLSQEPVEHAHFLNNMDEPLVSNALMGCRAQHPFFEFVINHLQDYVGWLFWTDILHATGPFMLTQALKSYHHANSRITSKHERAVTLTSDKIFQPTIDDSMLRHIIDKCRKPIEKPFPSYSFRIRHAELCSKLLSFHYANIPSAESLTNHHWTHLWGGTRYDPWGVFNTDISFNIRDLQIMRNVSRSIASAV